MMLFAGWTLIVCAHFSLYYFIIRRDYLDSGTKTSTAELKEREIEVIFEIN